MFGTLKPHRCSLDEVTQKQHMRYYCGLCQSLGTHFGQPYRALVSYDAVFLAILIDALIEEPATASQCRCPIMPIAIRDTVSPDSTTMRFASAIQILLADQKLADWHVEGKWGIGLVRNSLQDTVKSARTLLIELGVDVSQIEGIEFRQEQVEQYGVSPYEALQPTAQALQTLFAQMKNLPTMSTDEGQSFEQLEQIGSLLGSIIYLLDALEDLAKDYQKGNFNPCIIVDDTGREMISSHQVTQARVLVEDQLKNITQLIHQLPIKRHRSLIDNMIEQQNTKKRTALAQVEHSVLPQVEKILAQRDSYGIRSIGYMAYATLIGMCISMITTCMLIPKWFVMVWQHIYGSLAIIRTHTDLSLIERVSYSVHSIFKVDACNQCCSHSGRGGCCADQLCKCDCGNCGQCGNCEQCGNCGQCGSCGECNVCNQCGDCTECGSCGACTVCNQCGDCMECGQCETCPTCGRGCKEVNEITSPDLCSHCNQCSSIEPNKMDLSFPSTTIFLILFAVVSVVWWLIRSIVKVVGGTKHQEEIQIDAKSQSNIQSNMQSNAQSNTQDNTQDHSNE